MATDIKQHHELTGDDLHENKPMQLTGDVTSSSFTSGSVTTTVNQTVISNNTDVAANTLARHSHVNKALLDTYDQTNADLTDAVTKKHSHANKALLDTYDQTNANITDAISKKHEHTNLALLETYTQTNANLADAVTKKHTHSNQGSLDVVSGTNTGDETTASIRTKLGQAGASADGWLSTADWNTFNSKVSTATLASYYTAAQVDALIAASVDNDFTEYNDLGSFPVTGVSDLIYVAKDTNILYRWDGSAYVPLSSGTTGGGGAIIVQDEGVEVTPEAATVNFTGDGVTVSLVGDVTTVNIPAPSTPGTAFTFMNGDVFEFMG